MAQHICNITQQTQELQKLFCACRDDSQEPFSLEELQWQLKRLNKDLARKASESVRARIAKGDEAVRVNNAIDPAKKEVLQLRKDLYSIDKKRALSDDILALTLEFSGMTRLSFVFLIHFRRTRRSRHCG
jgi:hypothetical protein